MRIALVVLVVSLNLRAHRPGGVDETLAQLRFLGGALERGTATRMQETFPEGFVFTWALYGLASAQVAGGLEGDDERRQGLLQQAKRAIARVDSDVAREIFAPELDPPLGAFYASWSLYLRAEVLRAVGPGSLEPGFETRFAGDCERFAGALRRSHTPFLNSYRFAAWPADTAVGIAALGIHDQLFAPRFAATIAAWSREVRARLDARLGGISHAASPRDGAPAGGVRGSSLALMSRVLVDADPLLAREQYELLRSHFVDYRWGVPGVREFPRGESGSPDVDSGPLLLGYSGPAVVVGAAAARVHGDEALARTLLGAIEVGGVPLQWLGDRRYLLGLVPVGDAFIAWSRSSVPSAEPGGFAARVPSAWPIPAHLLSGVIVSWLLLPLVRGSRQPDDRARALVL